MFQSDISETYGPRLSVTDRLHISIDHIGSVILGADWAYPDLCAPFWRLYLNHDDGAAIALTDLPQFPLPAGVAVLVPAWLHWRAVPGIGVRHDYIQFRLGGHRRRLRSPRLSTACAAR